MPEDARIGVRVPAQVGDGLAVTQLDRMKGPSPAHGVGPRRSLTLIVSGTLMAIAAPRSVAQGPGPTRNKVPCRSGGSDPSIGKGRACSTPIT